MPGSTNYILSYEKKRAILKNNIFGVDIDPLAVEVSKFSLLLKALENSSLDWFVAPDGTIASFPLARTIPENFQPLIVPPGKDKYSSTHDEPYRTIIAEADNAFVQAGAYLCVLLKALIHLP